MTKIVYKVDYCDRNGWKIATFQMLSDAFRFIWECGREPSWVRTIETYPVPRAERIEIND